MSRSDVAEANNLSLTAHLRPGQELIIPRQPATILAARTERASAPSAVASRNIAEPAATPTVSQPARVVAVTYKVRQGDTLFSIAQLFDTTVAKIKKLEHASRRAASRQARG